MEYRRKIRFEYFEVVARRTDQLPNTPDIKFDLQKWIRLAECFSLEGRTYDYLAEQARLEDFYYRSQDNYWFMSFLRLRETNIPTTAYIDKEAEPIDLDDDEYIGEEVNSIYDVSTGTLMLQRNKFSLSSTGIQKYMNLIWKEKDGLEIHLRPILRKDTFSIINRKGSEFRRFMVRFADIKNKEIDCKESSPFTGFFDGLKKYGAVNAQVIITVGGKKDDVLSNDTVFESINDIKNNKDLFTKAEVGVKYDNEPVEILDLFSNNMHDFITFVLAKKTSLNSEYAENLMGETLKNRRPDIVNAIMV